MKSFPSCLDKQQKVRDLFCSAATPEEKYQCIIDLGKKVHHFKDEEKTEDRRIKGCQSLTYLKAALIDGKCHFEIDSEALISAGLGALLTLIYNDEPPEAVIYCPPTFLEEIGIVKSLSPSRSQGLANMYARIKLEAIRFLAK